MKTDRARRLVFVAGGLVLVLAGGACSGGNGSGSGSGGQGASGQGGGGGGTAGVVGTGGSTLGSGGTASTGGRTGGSTGTTSYANVGVCGERGSATADATSFDGYAEHFIIGEQGFGSDVCAVRFVLRRVGDAPGGCADCTWTQLLEYSNPSVVTDVDGVCARSDLALDTAAIANLVGKRVALGFANELGGAHGSARMLYVETTQTWDVFGNATWDEVTKAFKFDYRAGLCNYGP